jgi:hypothetical protein
MVSPLRILIGMAAAWLLIAVLGLTAQDGSPSVPVKSSYQFPVAEEDFLTLFRRTSADQPGVRVVR